MSDQHPGRRQAWLLCASLVALLAIYLMVITYWLSAHTVARYRQAEPGALVTGSSSEVTLLSLRSVSALPQGAGETATPQQGEAYVVATLRLTVDDPDHIAVSCGLALLGLDGRSWDYTYLSSADPAHADADYCMSVTPGQPATVTIGYAVPAVAVDRIAGVVVPQYNGKRDLVLVPPRS